MVSETFILFLQTEKDFPPSIQTTSDQTWVINYFPADFSDLDLINMATPERDCKTSVLIVNTEKGTAPFSSIQTTSDQVLLKNQQYLRLVRPGLD